jgi:hypothetical protein
MIMTITYDFSITDLIQAIGVGVGFPLAIWSIIKLFLKDKDKATQLKALTDIASSQETSLIKMQDQVDQLSSQTHEFQYQSSLFKESNELLKEQIDIQTAALLSDQDHKEKFMALETKKRKANIRPFFKPSGGSSSPGVITVPLINYGERAYFQKIEEIETSQVQIVPQRGGTLVIENNMKLEFKLRVTSPDNNSRNAAYKFNIIYKDDDDTLYKQEIKGVSTGFGIGLPLEIQ